MDPPPPAPPLSAAAPTNFSYPDSVESSPRSRNTDSWDDHQHSPAVPVSGGGGGGSKLRLMCSYGGHIVPRPHDKSLCYAGGDTRIIVSDRHSSLSDLTQRLSKTLLDGRSFTLKYQLPNEDLDSLISVSTDEDLENMIEEYDRLTLKSSRLRLFLFPSKSDSGSSIGSLSLLENSTKSEDWFLSALNGSARVFSESASVNCLLGLDDDIAINAATDSSSVKELDSSASQLESNFGNVKGVNSNNNTNKQVAEDVHSVPDSPMLDTMSSFGSSASSPSLANLPPIRVHAEDQRAALGGIEEQFSQLSVGVGVQKQDDGGFSVLTTAPAPAPAMALGSAGIHGEYSNRVLFEDERSEQGLPVGYRKPPQSQPLQLQSKPTAGVDLASPDSVSSDNSTTSNTLSRQRAMIYQDPVIQNPSGNNRVAVYPVDPKLSDPNSRVQMQQVQDSSFVLQNLIDQQQLLNHHHQQQQQLNHQQQQQHQLNHQQQQQQQQQQLNHQHQQQQFIQAGAHYIQHHPPGAMPISSFYPMYPPQQQPLHPQHSLDQQYPVFYMPARQAQAYNLPVHQSNYSETAASIPSSRPQTPPPPSIIPPSAAYSAARIASPPKPEMATGMYRTSTVAGQALSSQHQPQYVGFSQIHHPSQSIAPNSATTTNYGYEFADPAHAQLYYAQPMASQLAAQYQTMASNPAVVLPETSAQLPADNVKQQIRTSQP